ncbi:hypothetical protein LK994_00940 [Ferruginibacter lapsinanis]|uniref:LIC11966 family surface protein n=1 Tax=Ferruginibacter lapsinanis TaxID=563172 RepID=UPI001E3DBF66|nr:hypothetical protein [Ferruginibacter lapsinanis]UEG50039.1 hypothetical protein LK994_00940 [Ferruginibacter lapsinanis]
MTITETLHAQDFDNVITYMDYIGKQHQTIAKRFLTYNSAASHGKRAKKVENLRNKVLNEIDESRMNISGMPSFKGDKEYRDSAVSFMKLYYNVMNGDFSKIVDMEEISEQSYDMMEAYLLAKEMANKKLDDASEALHLAEKRFALAHNVNLIDGKDEIGKLMEEVSEVNHYYNPIYLIFFKSYKQEAYLMDAIEKKNINGIEQSKNTLLKNAEEGLAKLDTMKGFKGGDRSLIISCKKVLEFYIKEVKEKIPVIADFFLKNEAFEKMKIEYGKKSQPTQADVDLYNKGVKETNNAVNAYNEANNFLNNYRKDLVNNWNQTVDAYFDNHMPSYK